MASSKSNFVKYLAAYTGLNEKTVSAWANHEQGSSTVGGGNNWLNIETGSRGGSGPHSAEANYVETLSPQLAAKYTAEWLKKNQPGIAGTAGKSAEEQAAAIINSGWAESHYGHISPKEFLSAASGGGGGGGGESFLEKLTGKTLGNLTGPVGEAIPFLKEGAEQAGKTLDPLAQIGNFFKLISHWIEEPLTPVKFAGGGVLIYIGVRTLTGGSGVARESSKAVSHAAEIAAVIPK